MPITQEMLDKQPIYCVDDAAYERMMNSLKNGERFVKTYTSFCPHKNGADCDCPFNINFLEDGAIFRVNGGLKKPVVCPFILATSPLPDYLLNFKENNN